MWPLIPKKCNCENTGTNTSENAICNHCGLTTNDLVYTGANTECTQVNTGDTVSVAFQKIDYFICGGGLAQQILNQLQNNIEEYPDFITLVNGVVSCDVINACGEPPTTTTTTTTVIYNCNMTGEAVEIFTTTTTTTLNCASYSYDVDLYVCETCELTGVANINNSEELTIGGFYNWEGFTIQVIGFVECLGIPPGSFILDSTVESKCIDIPCPTTTTTTTI